MLGGLLLTVYRDLSVYSPPLVRLSLEGILQGVRYPTVFVCVCVCVCVCVLT